MLPDEFWALRRGDAVVLVCGVWVGEERETGRMVRMEDIISAPRSVLADEE